MEAWAMRFKYWRVRCWSSTLEPRNVTHTQHTGLGEEKTSANPEEAELTTKQIASALKIMGENDHDEKTIEGLQKVLGKREGFLKTMA